MMRAGIVTILLATALEAQVCRLSVAGLNRNRRVTGDIATECPDPLHSAPFGNWGVTSNFGPKRNGHQFDGWCHDIRVCDNNNNCFNVCRDGWYEWNSCTTHSLFRAPNCTLYNDVGCTAQRSTQDVNVLGTQTVDISVSCPRTTPNGSGYEGGGCNDVSEYARNDNFMSLYELDPITGDELVQSIYFPAISFRPDCNVWGCRTTGSQWSNPIRWDSPSTPKVFAEMAMIVNSGSFIDSNNVCRANVLSAQALSAATFTGLELAPDSIASIFTGDVTVNTESATAQPLPTTLSGVQVRLTDSAGITRTAGLVFASPRQINFVLPAAMTEGAATFSVFSGNTARASGPVRIARVVPGIFTADASGRGTAAAVGISVAANGSQTVQLSFECPTPQQCVAVPLDLGTASEQFVLSLFGTGIRGRTGLAGVQATIAGVPVDVQYAGAQGGFAGLDQVNLLVPKMLAARGTVEIRLTVDGHAANAVTVNFR